MKRIILMMTLLSGLVLSGKAFCSTDDGGLLYSGSYTATGMAYSYSTGQYSNTGVTAVNQVEIYRDHLIVNGQRFEQWNTDGQWLWYGRNSEASNHPVYLYNTSTGEMRWRFIFNFFGLQITDNFWVRGNQSAAYSGGETSSGSGGSYSDGASSSGSTGRTPHRCGLCDGKGWVPTTDGVSDYGSNSQKYCNDCRKYVPINHWHKTCPSCNGKGSW